jgi:hypothetical protein
MGVNPQWDALTRSSATSARCTPLVVGGLKNGRPVAGRMALHTHAFRHSGLIRLRSSPDLIYPAMPPRRPKAKNTPAKLASRMKRRFRIVLMRKTGEVLGTVEAADPHAAEKVAAIQFELDEFQRRRLLVQELVR